MTAQSVVRPRPIAASSTTSQSDWRYLREQILAGVVDAPVRSTRITPFGVTYEVVVTVDGLNGASLPVVTTWIVERNRPPRLTSTWVDIP